MIVEGEWQTMGYPGEKSTPVIAAKAASYEGVSYTQGNDNSAKEASYFLFSCAISTALVSHGLLIAYKHLILKALGTLSYLSYQFL